MDLVRYIAASVLCCLPAMVVHSADNIIQIADTPDAPPDQGDESTSKVVPLPEAEQQYSEATPVDAIIVDKDGNMTERQYTYDPAQGGVVINNYNQVAGPDCSLYFPVFGVGFLWWGGYWVDYNGYYWNGYGWGYVNYNRWHGRWNNYWHHNWNNKWNGYRRAHPNSRHAGGHNGRGNFHNNRGMNRQSHSQMRRQGGQGGHGGQGGRGGGGGHGGGGHGGGGHGGGGHGR